LSRTISQALSLRIRLGATGTFTSKEQIDTFIQQAEQRIFNSVQFPNFRKNQTGVLSANTNQYLEAPPDFLASYSLAVITNDSYEYLLNKDVNYIRAAYPNPTDTRGFRGITHSLTTTLLFWGLLPMPLTLLRCITFSILSLSLLHLQLGLGITLILRLLYGSLVEAYTYMKGEADIVAAYNKRYEEAMILAKRLGDGMERRDAYQVRSSQNDGELKWRLLATTPATPLNLA
jgi:hypothetical protein